MDSGLAAVTEPRNDEIELVDRLRSGDEGAFTALVNAHHGALIRLALTFVSDRGAAEEVVQDTWIGVLRGLPAFEGRASLKTWIFRILVNRARTRGARDGRFVAVTPAPDADLDDLAGRFDAAGSWTQPPTPWADNTPEGLLLRGEVLSVVKDQIERLPPGQRAVLTLRDVEGASAEEVCNVLAISETNQRVLLHRARTKVRAALEQHLTRR
ncbi:MAG: sigma-70 family RNA polymerase sigma factor [Acidobacteria bacterium]|nr:sigma-70 family RNA polymerase sigma factor [Acidobacteriota bacterium]